MIFLQIKMLQQIFLLNPVYVTLFWSILLNLRSKTASPTRLLLGKFMLVAFVVYVSHFVYYSELYSIYFFLDPVYQLASLLVFPLYHIYIRRITVDNAITWKKHLKYFITPVILTLLYLFGMMVTPVSVLKLWQHNRDMAFEGLQMQYLSFIYILIRILFVLQVVAVLIMNVKLIKVYGDKAQQYFSDFYDASSFPLKMQNFAMIFTGVSSITIALMGRDYFEGNFIALGIVSFIFSSMLFIIGYIGARQKTINAPSGDQLKNADTFDQSDRASVEKNILPRLIELFEVQHVYLNENLNIVDVANAIGTNRTYISNLINKKFNQNFSTFVNSYRIRELEKCIVEHPDATNFQLAELCGFSSTDTLKRVVKNFTGGSVTDLKQKTERF